MSTPTPFAGGRGAAAPTAVLCNAARRLVAAVGAAGRYPVAAGARAAAPLTAAGRGAALLVAALVVSSGSAGAGQRAVPTPESVLGFRVGADFELATYDESLAYFRALEAASDRIRLVEVGRTSFGRPWTMALVSSAANLENVERWREISLRLTRAEGLTDEDARQLAREGKAIVHVDGGLHATEVAHAQHTIELAYELVTADDPERLAVLDDVVVMLWPSVNPDGQNIVVEWYESNLGTPYEIAPLPWLYQKYVGHDNNRDAYMLDMIESRVLARTWRRWEPQIVYVHHQSSPFPTRIWLPPFAEPVAPHVHPLMARTVNLIGMAIAAALEERGQVGAVHMGTGFDAWYPGYVDYLPMLQNAAAFWTETALAHWASPRLYTVRDFPDARDELRPESLYSSPWEGGWWRLRDAVDYMLTASWATLDLAAKYREDLLYNRYQASRDVIRQYREGPPYAYLVPQDQRDPVAAVELLRRLAFNGIRVGQLDAAVTVDGIEHPVGTWVVPMDQEFAELARQLLEVQEYPDLREFPEGPPEQPYDASGWTLSYQMGVRVVEARSPLSDEQRGAIEMLEGPARDWRAELAAIPPTPARRGLATTQAAGRHEGPDGRTGEPDASPFDSAEGLGFDTSPLAVAVVPPPGRVEGSGPVLVLDPGQNNTFKALNRAWRDGARVSFEHGTEGATGESGESGRYLVTGLFDDVVDGLVDELALQAERRDDVAGAGRPPADLPRPRIGLYRPWTASMDEGWTRWLLEGWGFDFRSVRNADLAAGDLRRRFDVLVFAEQSPSSIVEGRAPGTVPPRYAGGIGDDGVRALRRFVEDGGTAVFLDRASDLAIEALDLPVRNVVADLSRDEFFTSGSILEVITDPFHPVMAGMPDRAAVFFSRSPVFTTEEGFSGSILARYRARGSPLMSGYLLGPERINGYAAAVDARVGDGHAVLVGFRPQWRGQPFGTFRVLFNAVLFHGELAAGTTANPEFWSPPAEPPGGGSAPLDVPIGSGPARR